MIFQNLWKFQVLAKMANLISGSSLCLLGSCTDLYKNLTLLSSGNCFYVAFVKGDPQPWNDPLQHEKQVGETKTDAQAEKEQSNISIGT